MKYNYITLGNDCSTSSALKNLGLREKSLPFDWIVSDMNSVIKCISENFLNFHKELRLNASKTRLIDYYGFEYPHDYPNSDIIEIENIGNGGFNEKIINDNWSDFIDLNIEKYNRRIKRFMDILKSETDLIVLYRGSISSVTIFNNYMKEFYNKENIKYIVATSEESTSEDVVTCQPEINGHWNDIQVWKEALNKIK